MNSKVAGYKINTQKSFAFLYTAAAAKSLQSCPTLCNPIAPRQHIRLPHPWDSPGKNTGVGCHFLSNAWKWKVKVKLLSYAQPSGTPWIAAFQAPPSMGFSRQEYWSGVPSPSPLKIVRQFQKFKHRIWPLGIQRNENICPHKNLYTNFIDALFVTVKRWT